MTQETLREAVARAIGAANLNCDPAGIDPDEWQNEADAAIATMLERLRTPSDDIVMVGIHAWMNRDLNDPDTDPVRDCFRAMLTAFQQENSDGR